MLKANFQSCYFICSFQCSIHDKIFRNSWLSKLHIKYTFWSTYRTISAVHQQYSIVTIQSRLRELDSGRIVDNVLHFGVLRHPPVTQDPYSPAVAPAFTVYEQLYLKCKGSEKKTGVIYTNQERCNPMHLCCCHFLPLLQVCHTSMLVELMEAVKALGKPVLSVTVMTVGWWAHYFTRQWERFSSCCSLAKSRSFPEEGTLFLYIIVYKHYVGLITYSWVKVIGTSSNAGLINRFLPILHIFWNTRPWQRK